MSVTSILVVDPSRSGREHLSDLLDSFGYSVITTAKGPAVLNRLDEYNPDLVIMDEAVNGLTPESLLSEIQARDLDTLTVIVSENPDLDRGMDWVTSGAFAYLGKPVCRESLKRVIERGLENQEAFYQVVTMAQDLSNANKALEKEKTALKDKSDQLRFLYDLGAELSTTLDRQAVVRTVSETVVRLTGADLVVLLTAFNPEDGLRLHPDRRLRSKTAEDLIRDMADELDTDFSLEGWPHHVKEPKGRQRPLTRRPRHHMTLPLKAAGKHCGLVGLYSGRPLNMDPDRWMLLDSVAMQAAQALFNAYQHESALKLAAHDPLTGLFNRRVFDESMEREFERFLRYGQDLSLILIDLDHFKKVNDTYGHKAGDKVLRDVADIIRASVRATDIPARIGGEEFAVILPDTKLEASQALARRIETALRRHTMDIEGARVRQTVSQGVADATTTRVKKVDELIRLADHAMYLAKEEGRNTIRLATDLEECRLLEGDIYVCRQ